MKLYTLASVLTLLCAGLASAASAQDKVPKNAKDHPMISSYEGSHIVAYEQSAFEEFHLIVKKVTEFGGVEKNPKSTKTLEGKVTRITYKAPSGRGTLEVFRNYDQELEKHGFKDIFRCTNKVCGGNEFNHAVGPWFWVGGSDKDQRYLAAKLSRPDGDVYVAVWVGDYRQKGDIRVQLDVIELQPMDTGKVKIDPKKLASDIGSEGHVAIYSIYFETDSATLKPESDPTLATIAEMLRQRPKLELLVVGHTDNKGGLEHNRELSKRRAQSVVKALTSKHKISAKRLTAEGVGYLAPVANNKSEASRAKNRRVELVER